MVKLNIKKQMEKKHISLHELSLEIGETDAVLRNLCSGKNESIRFDIIEKLCDFFDCSPSSIFKIEKEKDPELKYINFSDTLINFQSYLERYKFKIYNHKFRRIFETIYKSLIESINNDIGKSLTVNLFYKGEYIATYNKETKMFLKTDNNAFKNTFYDHIIDKVIDICYNKYGMVFANNTNKNIAETIINGVIESVVYYKKYLK